eukprot:1150448-Pelagomonas_calceolata.AAC.1
MGGPGAGEKEKNTGKKDRRSRGSKEEVRVTRLVHENGGRQETTVVGRERTWAKRMGGPGAGEKG